IALKIEQMIKEGYTVYDWENGEYNARPCRYSDFCILLRSKKDRVLPYQKELEKRNIPNFCDYSQGYFNEYEISVILNFLRVIDNPLLDVPLLSVMMSPIFSFSADDVAKIRKGKKKKSLYSCLLESEYKDLINILEEFRKKATLLSPEELLQEIYDTTDFIELCYALDKGEQKDVNLRLLISYAKKYQQYSNGGLSGFLHYIDTIIEKKEDFLSANVFSKSENSVKIMSIHSSKGLEFPIVIVANCDKKFNAMDEKKFIQFNPNLFIGTSIKDDLHKYDTIPKKAVQLANKTQAVCEEMRCLYVALTRAKEKIIVVASKYNSKKEPESIGLYNILKAGSFIKWILMAISEQSGFYKQAIITDDYFKNDISIEKAKVTAVIDEDLLVRLQKNFDFKYKNEELTKISAKITATQMAKEEISIKSEPTFIIENGLTSAMKGTALHNFMQYANFHNAENNLLQEIQRLVMQEFITKEQADVLDENSIKMFLSSNLYQRIKKSKQVYREFPFLHFIDSGLINSDVQGHEVLIQGIADLIFIEDDKAVIVDYKTDRVSNENMLVERYKNQLEIYKKAIAQVLNIKVKQAYIYSMNMSKEILI
ncbi:MAG: 3'-5' exonuclease, partial [Oscillospiraceae bacterium]